VKQHNQFVGTYESCSTAAFRHGRTETMRPLTVATRDFCDQISKPLTKRPSISDLRALMEKCSQLHNQLTKDAAMGQGFDRHLFGLKHVAVANNLPMPDLFKDAAYSKINHNIISTSTLSSPALLAGGFGPVVADGYGIGYNIQDDYLGSVVTSYKGQRNGTEFIECLKEAYLEIAEVLQATSSKVSEK
jgi:carnitine O-palmitoyltransferase 2